MKSRAFQLPRLLCFVGGAVLLGSLTTGHGEDVDQNHTASQSLEEAAEPSARERPDLGPDPLALPQWSAEEAAALKAGRPANLGGGLWTDDLYPLEWAPPVARFAGFLESVPGPLSAERLKAYQQDPRGCVDPQRLLLPEQKQVLEAQLRQLGTVMRQPLQLWVLAPEQEVSAEVLNVAVQARGGRGGVAAMAWGDPTSLQWAGVLLSDTALADARRAALEARTPLGQWQEVVSWLGAALFRAESESAIEVAAHRAAEAEAAARQSRRGWISLVVAALVSAGLVWWRWRPSARMPLYFPEQTVPARLAGPYSSGAGAAVRW